MPVLTLQQPFTTTVPTLTVENRLVPGRHVFQLVVVNAQGVQSDPVSVVVVVLPTIVRPGITGPLGTATSLRAAAAETVSGEQPASAKKAAGKRKKTTPATVASERKKAAETTQPAGPEPTLPAGAEKEPELAKPAKKKSTAVGKAAESSPRPGSETKKKKTSASRKKTRKKTD